MACVTSLTTGLSGSCEAVKKPGGANKSIYVGSVKDLTSVTYGTDGQVKALTLASGKQMVKMTGRIGKNTASEPITAEGEGNVNIYVHTVSPVLYHFTQAEMNAIADLDSLDQSFFIIPMRSGQIKVYGLSADAETLQDYGLKLAEGDNAINLNLNDQNAATRTYSGEMLNPAQVFGTGIYADDISTLEGYLTPAV